MPEKQNIENLLQEWRDAQPLNVALQRRFDQAFTVDFNFNSNHLEGNTLTYGQTKLLLLFGKIKGEALFRDCEEMKAHNFFRNRRKATERTYFGR